MFQFSGFFSSLGFPLRTLLLLLFSASFSLSLVLPPEPLASLFAPFLLFPPFCFLIRFLPSLALRIIGIEPISPSWKPGIFPYKLYALPPHSGRFVRLLLLRLLLFLLLLLLLLLCRYGQTPHHYCQTPLFVPLLLNLPPSFTAFPYPRRPRFMVYPSSHSCNLTLLRLSLSFFRSPEVTGGLCEQNCFFHHNSLLCDYYRIPLPLAFPNQSPFFFSFSPLTPLSGSLPFVLVTVAHVSP